MPTYDYHCPANGRVIEVSHKISDQVASWGELCRRAGLRRRNVQLRLSEARRPRR
jgi:predicted nucleic acid-binding Zn ribbon protein